MCDVSLLLALVSVSVVLTSGEEVGEQFGVCGVGEGVAGCGRGLTAVLVVVV